MTTQSAAPVMTVGSTLNIGRFSLDWMVVALIAVLALIAFSLYRAQKDGLNKLDLYDLVMENGRLSRIAFVMMGSFAVTSWMMVTLTLNGKMTEGIFGLYCTAWIAPIVTRIIKGPALPQDQTGSGKP